MWKIIVAVLVFFIALNYKKSDLLALVGCAFAKQNKADKAMKLYSIAEKFGSLSVGNRIRYADLLLESGDEENANSRFSILAMENISDAQRVKLAEHHCKYYLKSNDYNTAIEMLEGVLDKCMTQKTCELLGAFYLLNENLATALHFNTEAYEMFGDNPHIINNLAYTYLLTSDYENAAEYYNKLFCLTPDFPEGYFEYGKYLIENGETNKGIGCVKQALDCKFDFTTKVTKEEIENYLQQCQNN